MTTKELSPVFAAGVIALKKDGATVKSVAEAIVGPAHITAPQPPIDTPDFPAPLELTDKVKQALARIPEVFASVNPDRPQVLTDDERVALFEEYLVLKEVDEVVSKRRENIKEIERHDMDLVAEERGQAVPRDVRDPKTGRVIVAATQRDSKGHYVLASKGNPDRLNVPGTNQAWSREYRAGAVEVDTSKILDLYETGEITREQYLSMTRETRTFDEQKFRAALLADPALIKVLQQMTKVGLPGTSMFVRKAT